MAGVIEDMLDKAHSFMDLFDEGDPDKEKASDEVPTAAETPPERKKKRSDIIDIDETPRSEPSSVSNLKAEIEALKAERDALIHQILPTRSEIWWCVVCPSRITNSTEDQCSMGRALQYIPCPQCGYKMNLFSSLGVPDHEISRAPVLHAAFLKRNPELSSISENVKPSKP